MTKHVVILGGGLAGLSCGYELAKTGVRVTILEREPQVGGMAQSFEEGDPETAGQPGSDYWCYDYGPHRFHTKEKELMRHVNEIIGDNKVWARRQSRIYMFGKFFNYPLNVKNILENMSKWKIFRFITDSMKVRFLDITRLKKFEDENFREWVERRFGTSLADTFFVQYTEKAWGMPATEISADWASQRITLLSLRDTIMKTLFPPRNMPRTLITDFVYPRVGGIGELARGYKRRIEEMGGRILLDSPAILVHHEDKKIARIEFRNRDGKRESLTGDEYISTIPVTAMARSLRPKPPAAVMEALGGLDYVAIVFIYLKLDKPKVTDDNWVYLPEKHLTIHRISEFKNFSECCAPPHKTMICAEITCRAGDDIWRASPERLREIAVKDLSGAGLIQDADVEGCFIKRVPFAYPIYDLQYAGHLANIMEYVHGLEGMTSGGRQGLFRYNNMDQSIEMGRLMGQHLGETVHENVAMGDDLFEPLPMDDLYRDESDRHDLGANAPGEPGDENVPSPEGDPGKAT